MKEPDSWITINGQHVPIFEGESKREATSRFINKKMSRVAKNKDKYETIDRFKERKATNKFDEKSKKTSLKDFESNEDKTKFKLKDEERKKVFKEMGLHDDEELEKYRSKYDDEKLTDTQRRAKLMRYTQDNKEQIAQYGREFDKETERKAFEKSQRGEGLTKKEYFGYIGRNEKPGDIISDVTADGEDVIVAKDGKWVRKSRIKEYNNNPSANKDAIVDIEEEEHKIERQEAIKNFKRRKK